MADSSGKHDGIGSQAGNGIDGLPPCMIHVDKEGRMWHQGAEMVHEGINSLLRRHVERDDQGRYIISFQGQRCYVEVEDTFFVITRVHHRAASADLPEALVLTLNDGGKEDLAPAGLSQSSENVMYARVKNGRFPARFLRPAYYQLAEFVTEEDGRYVISLNGQDFPVA